MTGDRSQPDFEEDLLARFLRDLEAAPARAAVVRDYAARHPPMADELARLEVMNRLVARAGSDESYGDAPRQLGEFRIIRRIARGGMGDIYEAVQDRLNRRVAVKTIRRGRISPQARGRFFREQRVLARLHQTHIVPIHTAGEEGDLLYFAMPFIDGAALHHVVQAAAAFETRGPGSKTPSLAKLADRVTDDRMASDSPAPASERPRTLSADYFRSVAQIIADAAEAVDHAHRLNILHRDLKPSNILIDRNGQCWIIDFGLAGYVGQISGPISAATNEDSSEALTTGGIIGTPQYMAPEQWRGEPADVRTDVWGLGATLYELLTLRRAFDGPSDLDVHDHVLTDEPPPPRTLVRNVPADLAAVCRKAMRKNALERYPSAQAVADDLRRWLRHEPVRARPARAVRRTALWARRNRGWAAAMVISGFAAVAGAALAGFYEERSQEGKRQDLIRQVQGIRQSVHNAGWFINARGKALDAMALRRDAALRDQTAALLVGYDAHSDPTLTFSLAASSIAFDPSGRSLLVGGLNDKRGRPDSGPRLIDVAAGTVTPPFESKGAGPVAFRPDGSSLQLVPKNAGTVVLWDAVRQTVIHEFSLDPEAASKDVTEFNYPVLALSADGSRAAASTRRPDGHDKVGVWDTVSGQRLRQWNRMAKSLALSEDGTVVAIGESDGKITVESLINDALRLQLRSDVLAITALAFGRDPFGVNESTTSWRLASGDAGTRITVWDLRTGQHRCHCDGSAFGITALAFSPNGMTLASADRQVRLWDAATGRQLLEIEIGNIISGVCFDPTGRRLAVCSPTASPGINPISRTQVFDLEPGRGTMTLHGLFGQVDKSVFSADGQHFAAISQQWQVAVWHVPSHRLIHVFDGPRGEYVDNAALAFDDTGARLACAGGTQAKSWEVATGRLLQTVRLPPGLQDALAFDRTGQQLWSVRCETATEVAPYSHADPKDHPRVYPVRDLLGPDPARPTPITKMPNEHAYQIVMACAGTVVVIKSKRKEGDQSRLTIRAFSVPTAGLLWSADSPEGGLTLDALGESVGYIHESQGQVFVDISSGSLIRKTSDQFGPGWKWWLRGPRRGLGVGDTELADIDIDGQFTNARFSPCGRYLAISRSDGSVVIYELEKFRRQLAILENR
jgi:eukaryotic-like serine/threonine-protein kinase